jgi:hypothetical protein
MKRLALSRRMLLGGVAALGFDRSALAQRFTTIPAPTAAAAIAQFLARLATQPTGARLAQYQTLITTLVNAAIWPLLDALYIFDAIDTATALTNLISSKYTGVVHGTMTFAANAGYTGDGTTGYIDTQFNPSTAGGANYSLNSASMGFYVTGGTTTSLMGAVYSTSNADGALLQNLASAGFYSFYSGLNEAYSTIAGGPALNGNPLGFIACSRRGSSGNESAYFNDNVILSPTSGAEPSTYLPNKSILIGAYNDTSGADQFTSTRYSAAFIGAGLTDAQMAVLATAINAFLTVDSINSYPVVLASSALAAGGSITAPKFGINTHTNINNTTTITPAQNVTMLQYLGVSAVRIDAVDWQKIEPTTKGTYVWSGSGAGTSFGDPYINGANGLLTAGFTVNVALAYSNTLYESSYFTAPTDTAGKTAFATYAAAVAARYGATKMIYEIWNEENISNGAGNYSWAPAASAANFAALVDQTVAAILAAAPGATIIPGAVVTAGGTGYIAPDTFIASYLSDSTTLANQAGIAFHPYSGTLSGAQTPEWAMNALVPPFVTASSSKPQTYNEFSYEVVNCNNSFTTTAVFNMRQALALIILGCVTLQPYNLVMDSSDFGYFDASFNPLPSAVGYKAIIAAFSGATAITYASKTYHGGAAADFYQIKIEKSSTSYVIIAWASISTFTFTYAAGALLLSSPATDLFGNAVSVSNDGSGNLTYKVSDATGPVILTLAYS